MTAMSMPSCNELSAIDDIYHSYNERRRSSRNVAGIRKDSDHHNVYVVYLRNPKKDGRAGYYVGMTGLSPERRFENHKNGIKAARVVKRCGERLVPKLYAHLNPMPYAKAKEMEVFLADRSEEHTSELQSQSNLVCRLLLEKKKTSNRQTRLRLT